MIGQSKEKHAERRFKERMGFTLNRNWRAKIKADIERGRAEFLWVKTAPGESRTCWLVKISYEPLRYCRVIYSEYDKRLITVMKPGRLV